MSEQERENFTGSEEREASSEEPDVEAHKRKAYDGGPELEEDDGDDVEAHRRR